jgi:hypothetical protein
VDLDLFLQAEAAAGALLGLANGAYFAAYASRTVSRSRRVGAACLALVNLAIGLEGLAFLVVGAAPANAAEAAALAIARTGLLLGAAFITLLIARQSGSGLRRKT